MKKTLIILSICLISLSSKISYSQSQNTIVDTNSIWSIYNELVIAESIPTSYYIHLKGDTIIDSKHYIKVWTNNDLSLTDDIEFHALIREENQKTYVRYYHSGMDSILGENLLYDFSLSNGDTFNLNIYEEVFSFNVCVDSIQINNEMRKRIILSGNFISNMTWVEKIGCLEAGLLYESLFGVGVIEKLLCYYYNDNVLYSNPEFNYCNIVGINYPRKEENQIKVYPTIIDKEINISSDKYPISLSIIDLFGREVFRKEINNNRAINLDFLKEGAYIIKLKHKDNIIIRKIIKK
ncbi:MAG: hypothetical protein H6Q16_602 [Bacteroidetes bacterium]|nr:hypothetical protein [Bacteroidota bacterium]